MMRKYHTLSVETIKKPLSHSPISKVVLPALKDPLSPEIRRNFSIRSRLKQDLSVNIKLKRPQLGSIDNGRSDEINKTSEPMIKSKLSMKSPDFREDSSPQVEYFNEDFPIIQVNPDPAVEKPIEKNALLSALASKLFGVKFYPAKLSSSKERVEGNFKVNGTNYEVDLHEMLKNKEEEYEKLSKEFSALQKNYSRLEKSYNAEVVIIAKENKQLMKTVKMYEIEAEKLVESQARHKEQDTVNLKEALQKKDELIQELRETIKNKSIELFVGSEIMKNDKNLKEAHKENVKSLEIQISLLNDRNKNLDIDLISTKKFLQETQKHLEDEKQKARVLEDQVSQVNEISKDNFLLHQKLNELQKSFDLLNKNHRDTVKEFMCYREKAEVTEKSLKAKLDKSSNSSETLGNGEKPDRKIFKSQRLNTLIPVPYELTSQLHEKIENLKEVNRILTEQLEAGNKNLSHLREMLQEKNELLMRYEKSSQDNIKRNSNILVDEIKNFGHSLKKKFEQGFNNEKQLFECKYCKKLTKGKFLYLPCEHLSCKLCMTDKDTCPICTNPSQAYKIKLITKASICYEPRNPSFKK